MVDKMRKMNIVYIYADDLGRGMLSCYGQKIISTPNIDHLADNGMRFTNFCANAFCAPARASLICGIHDAHAGRWTFTPGGSYKKLHTGELSFSQIQEGLQHAGVEHACGDEYIASVAKKAGYFTGQIGKLEWGFAITAEQLVQHGWDYHYGYYDHIQCHGYYPPFVFENGHMISINGNTDVDCGMPKKSELGAMIKDMSQRVQFSQDLFDGKIFEFIENHRHHPFFLYHPSQLPHGPVFYPTLHEQVAERSDLTRMEKEYASMVLRLDETVGKITRQLDALGLLDQTLIIFASDNGHAINYEQPGRCQTHAQLDGQLLDDGYRPFRTQTCGDVFNGNDGMAGLKFSNFNGGCTIPFIASCPTWIEKGSVCKTMVSNYDTLATIAELIGVERPSKTDGISYLSLLQGNADSAVHDYIIYAGDGGPAIVHKNGYKLRAYMNWDMVKSPYWRDFTNDPETDYQLFHVLDDYEEANNIAALNPEMVHVLKKILVDECDGNLYNGWAASHLSFPLV